LPKSEVATGSGIGRECHEKTLPGLTVVAGSDQGGFHRKINRPASVFLKEAADLQIDIFCADVKSSTNDCAIHGWHQLKRVILRTNDWQMMYL
jgi:hypothetical protein